MKSQILSLGFSPCPNDCFIFDALLHGKIDTERLKFKPVIEDVEALNKRAFKNKLDITKLSFFTYAQVQKEYSLLDSGSALGFGVGPLVVSAANSPLTKGVRGLSALNNNHLKVAIPGKNTTANLLFSLAYPHLKNKTEVLFSEIEKAVLKGKFDLGVIIHESRFTYQQKGLKKIIDLGEWWEKKTKSPIPLGGIFIKKNLTVETHNYASLQKKINRVIRRSIEFAFANPDSSKGFVKKHSQEMDEAVIKQHINLYVNKFSLSLGKEGRKAVNTLLKKILAVTMQ